MKNKFIPTLFNEGKIKCTYRGGELDGEKEYVCDTHVVRLIKELNTDEAGIPIHYEYYTANEPKKLLEDGSEVFQYQQSYKSWEELQFKLLKFHIGDTPYGSIKRR